MSQSSAASSTGSSGWSFSTKDMLRFDLSLFYVDPEKPNAGPICGALTTVMMPKLTLPTDPQVPLCRSSSETKKNTMCQKKPKKIRHKLQFEKGSMKIKVSCDRTSCKGYDVAKPENLEFLELLLARHLNNRPRWKSEPIAKILYNCLVPLRAQAAQPANAAPNAPNVQAAQNATPTAPATATDADADEVAPAPEPELETLAPETTGPISMNESTNTRQTAPSPASGDMVVATETLVDGTPFHHHNDDSFSHSEIIKTSKANDYQPRKRFRTRNENDPAAPYPRGRRPCDRMDVQGPNPIRGQAQQATWPPGEPESSTGYATEHATGTKRPRPPSLLAPSPERLSAPEVQNEEEWDYLENLRLLADACDFARSNPGPRSLMSVYESPQGRQEFESIIQFRDRSAVPPSDQPQVDWPTYQYPQTGPTTPAGRTGVSINELYHRDSPVAFSADIEEQDTVSPHGEYQVEEHRQSEVEEYCRPRGGRYDNAGYRSAVDTSRNPGRLTSAAGVIDAIAHGLSQTRFPTDPRTTQQRHAGPPPLRRASSVTSRASTQTHQQPVRQTAARNDAEIPRLMMQGTPAALQGTPVPRRNFWEPSNPQPASSNNSEERNSVQHTRTDNRINSATSSPLSSAPPSPSGPHSVPAGDYPTPPTDYPTPPAKHDDAHASCAMPQRRRA